MPELLVQIMAFMIRYLDVVTGGDAADAGGPRVTRLRAPATRASGRCIARSAGALFIRSYERGERVHLAMLSRGYTGTMPERGGGR